ncbi:MAG TPA: DNA polymerase III subunit delta' [Nitratifractor sp.]|jgi:DNA polymerase-3 subunit delta'|nr:DNA polymerase III subunit delta' [Nitratifractor sp.]
MELTLGSQIIISSDFHGVIEKLRSLAGREGSFELFIKEDENFLVSDANEVIAKAYLASQEKVYICLASRVFSEVVQNRLLKIIEEPPRNKEFILITPNKSALLPTIKSRLIVTTLQEEQQSFDLDLDIEHLDLQKVYTFVQENKNLKQNEAIEALEAITLKALKSENFTLDEDSIALFANAREVLNLGSPTDFVLTTVLLKLLAKKRKRVR